jgi:hypothetical protein
MEKSGLVKSQWGRIKLFTIILSSCFIAAVIITSQFHFKKEKKVLTRSSVKGIVQNKAGRPVADAIIMITKGSHEFNDIASVSNEKGEFFLSNVVIPGKYVLQIQHDNGIVTKTINVQSADSIIIVNF